MTKYVGIVNLFWKGKSYGSTARQVSARSREEATKILKDKFSFKNNQGKNVVKVTSLKQVSKK